MKTIVIPVDFSPHSGSAVEAGVYVARKTRARIHLLNVIDGPENWDLMTADTREQNPDVEKRMKDAVMHLDNFSNGFDLDGLDVVADVKTGIAHERIVSYARSNNADLIIIGAHGAGESDPKYIGSTAQKVMRVAPCPVLSVKTNFNPASVRNILFPSDFEDGAANASRVVREIARTFDAAVDLTFIRIPGGDTDAAVAEQRMLQALPGNGIEVRRHIFNNQQKDQGIVEAAKQFDAGIIAMVTHHRKSQPTYSFGITESVLFLSDVPVLSVVA